MRVEISYEVELADGTDMEAYLSALEKPKDYIEDSFLYDPLSND